MSEDEEFMARFVAVATGEVDGHRWTIRVNGASADLYSIVLVERPDGGVGGGGSGGPALWPGRLIEVSTGIGDDGPIWVVGRTDPSVDLVLIETEGQEPISLRPEGDVSLYGVRFFATLLPRQTRFVRVVARAEDGRLLDEHMGPFVSQPLPRPSTDQRAGDNSSVTWRPASEL